jgi:signal transduction histidine kinase
MDIKAHDFDPIWIAPDKIHRVLNNLLDNPFQHTEAGGEIHISTDPAGDDVLISVSNSGAATPQADLPYIFDVFYQGDASRRDHPTGPRRAGLGLAIARGFVEAHHGAIWAASDPQRGTVIRFRLPCRESAPA